MSEIELNHEQAAYVRRYSLRPSAPRLRELFGMGMIDPNRNVTHAGMHHLMEYDKRIAHLLGEILEQAGEDGFSYRLVVGYIAELRQLLGVK